MAIQAERARGVPALVTPFIRSLGLYAVEMSVFLVFFAAYFILRGLPDDRIALSTANARSIIEFERSLGIYHEAAWQAAVLDNSRLIGVANFTYRYLHLPLLLVLGYAFFHTDVHKYRVLRNAILVSGAIGLFFYAFYPVTPPRLLASAGFDQGFVDTLLGERRPRPGMFSNDYAAVPSYHFGWISLAAFGACWCWRSPIVRTVAVLFAGLMWWSIVVTGNHYFVDMAIGAAIVAAAFALSLRWERWAQAHPGRISSWTLSVGGHRLPF